MAGYDQVEGVGSSALSRFFNVYDWDSDRCYEEMEDAQWCILLEGEDILAEGKRRWALESFLGEGKHLFGLAQFALRTARGLDRCILTVFLVFTLTMLHRSEDMAPREAARLALHFLFPEVRLNHLLNQLQNEEEFLHQHSYSLSYARCKF